jgi:hypothetical protein
VIIKNTVILNLITFLKHIFHRIHYIKWYFFFVYILLGAVTIRNSRPDSKYYWWTLCSILFLKIVQPYSLVDSVNNNNLLKIILWWVENRDRKNEIFVGIISLIPFLIVGTVGKVPLKKCPTKKVTTWDMYVVCIHIHDSCVVENEVFCWYVRSRTIKNC